MCQKFSDWHIVSPCGETLSYEIFFKFSNKHNSIKMIFFSFNHSHWKPYSIKSSSKSPVPTTKSPLRSPGHEVSSTHIWKSSLHTVPSPQKSSPTHWETPNSTPSVYSLKRSASISSQMPLPSASWRQLPEQS